MSIFYVLKLITKNIIIIDLNKIILHYIILRKYQYLYKNRKIMTKICTNS